MFKCELPIRGCPWWSVGSVWGYSAFIVSLVIFFSVSLLPGSYASAILPECHARGGGGDGREARPQSARALALYRLVGAAATGDLGQSFAGRPVMAVLGPRLVNTITLASITAVIAAPLAIVLQRGLRPLWQVHRHPTPRPRPWPRSRCRNSLSPIS